MKKIHYAAIFVVFFVIVSVIFLNKNNEPGDEKNIIPNEQQETIGSNQKESNPYIKYFNGNGDLIKEYTKEEIEKLAVSYNLYKPIAGTGGSRDPNGVILNPEEEIEKEILELSDSHTQELFVVPYATFSKKIFIGGIDRQFSNPKSIIIEVYEQVESMFIKGFNSEGKEVVNIELGEISGGLQIPLDIISEESYSIELQTNESKEKTINLMGGIVVFDKNIN